jgi:hypothetical protein
MPVTGVKKVRNKEKMEKINPRTIPFAPRDWAYPGRRGAMMPTPSMTVKTARRSDPRILFVSPGPRFILGAGELS